MSEILTSLHGRLIGLGADGALITPAGYLAGRNGSQFHAVQPDKVRLFDDFGGAAISNAWGVEKGSDGGAANFAINAALNGTVRGTTGAGAGATMAVNGVQLDYALNFEADSLGLAMQARVKLSAITTIACFVGFTNQIGTLQMPCTGSGAANGLTFNAADCVGMLFDTTMTTKDWWCVGQAGSTPATAQDSGFAPVAATYDIFRINVDGSGNATFWHGNALAAGGATQIGVLMKAAVTKTVPLTPVIAAFRRSAASATLDVDYVYVSNIRI